MNENVSKLPTGLKVERDRLRQISKLLNNEIEAGNLEGLIIFGRDSEGKMITMTTQALRCDLLGYAQCQLTYFFSVLAAGLESTGERVELPEVED
jgi:hypothetical protein